MRDELLAKIQHVLDRKIRNEMQVVYLMVELRKLMDREKYNDPVLRMYSNWVAHTSLEKGGKGPTLVLKQFDMYISKIFDKGEKLGEQHHMSLGSFLEALSKCFKHFGLRPKFLFESFAELKAFFKLYCAIVSECPLVYTASTEKLKYIRKVELTGVTKLGRMTWPFIQWKLTFHNGRVMNWGFNIG